jgi:hypothetical protein
MKTSSLAIAALLGLVAALPAAAQNNALTLYGGYRGGGSFEELNSPFSPLDMKSSASGALTLDIAVDGSRQVQILGSYQSTELGATATTPTIPLSVGYLHFGGTNYFQGAIGQGAYVAGGVGVTRLAPDLAGLSSEIYPSLNLALGYQWPITGALSLKAEVRGYFTLINSSGAIFCSGGCAVAIKGDGLTQVEGLLGLSLAF